MALYLGANKVSGIWLDDKEIKNIWMGTDLIYTGVVPEIDLNYFTIPKTLTSLTIQN